VRHGSVDLVKPKQGDLVLDVATGTGNTAPRRTSGVVGLDDAGC
jgi:ubiquinone/menaquinone biosynthesis C-methylase UbiE